MRQYHIAEVNLALMKGAMDDPVMAGFVALLAPMNQLADESPGFVWRLETEDGDSTAIRVFEPEGGKKDDADFINDRQGIVKTEQNNPTYAAMVESVDTSLGRMMQALESKGIADNTAIILTSDHGGLSTRGLENGRSLATSNFPLRQGKGSIFEGGTRVPLIVKWPGHIRVGSTSSVQVTGTDHQRYASPPD